MGVRKISNYLKLNEDDIINQLSFLSKNNSSKKYRVEIIPMQEVWSWILSFLKMGLNKQ